MMINYFPANLFIQVSGLSLSVGTLLLYIALALFMYIAQLKFENYINLLYNIYIKLRVKQNRLGNIHCTYYKQNM